MEHDLDSREEISLFENDEQSVFAEQLRQFGVRPFPITYGLLARTDSTEAEGWFWTGKAMDGCLISVKRIAQRSDMNLVESPSRKQWRVSLLADVDAKVVVDHAQIQNENIGLEDFENPLSLGLKRRLLIYGMEPGRKEYPLRKGSFHHICEISLLPCFFEHMASMLAVDRRVLERMFSHSNAIEKELPLRNAISSFSASRMRLPGAELYLRGYAYKVIADLIDFCSEMNLRKLARQGFPTSRYPSTSRQASLMTWQTPWASMSWRLSCTSARRNFVSPLLEVRK